MKRKPKSIVDFLKVVACVKHPDLRWEHCLFLNAVALTADWNTGRNGRPGRAFLEVAMGLTWNRCALYAKGCEALGLVERTQNARSGDDFRGRTYRSMRNEWRICLEHDAYPDTYPDFNDPENDDLSTPGNDDHSRRKGHRPAKDRSSFSGDRSLHDQNKVTDTGVTHPLTHPYTPHHPPGQTAPTTSTAQPANVVGGVVGEKPSATELAQARERLVDTFMHLEQEAPNTSPAQDKAIEKLIEEHGEEVTVKALKMDLQEPAFFTSKDGQRTRYPLTRFLGRADRLVRQIKIQGASQGSKLTPEKIDHINEIQNLRHSQVWAVLDSVSPEDREWVTSKDPAAMTPEELTRAHKIFAASLEREPEEVSTDSDFPF